MRLNSARLISLVAFVLLLGGVLPARAHGFLVRAIPEDRATLERAPARLQYWFSETLEPEFSSLTVRDTSGAVIATGGISPDNSTLLTVRLSNDLPDGAYIVDMRLAFASDGHVIAERRMFFVGKTVESFEAGGARYQIEPLEVVWRGITLISAVMLFGLFATYAGILLPAWSNPAYPAGLLPPRVMGRLNALVISGLALALVGNVLALVQQTAVFFDTDIGQVVSGQLWTVVRTGTRFGDVWTARMVLLGIVAAAFAASLYYRKEQPRVVRAFWSANVWAMTLVIATFSVTSHAAGAISWPWAAVLNDWLHALAVSFWVGGMATLALVLPMALAPYTGEARRTALLAVMRRFSRWAVVCLALVIASGLYSASNWITAPDDLAQTQFGGALVFKLILTVGLVAVGALHHIALRPERYQRFQAFSERAQGFVPTLRLESLIGAAVLASVGLLSSSPVPVPDFIRESVPAPRGVAVIQDLTVNVTLTPGGPGINTTDVAVTRDGQPVEGLKARLQMIDPARDRRGDWEAAEDSGGGLYVAAGGAIDRAGLWWSRVQITEADGTRHDTALAWTVSASAAIQQSQPPTASMLVALTLVIGTLGWAAAPAVRGQIRQLDLNPATITIAILAVVGTALLSALGFAVIANSQAQYEAAINPAPRVVNPVLPDAASIERGRALYAAQCPAWQTANLKPLIERLPRTRDEELYFALRDGWRDIPACDAALGDDQRWDVVNAIRTFEG
jgi:copper transport protein